MMIVLRLLPFLAAVFNVGIFYLQLERPLSYPWLVFIGAMTLPCLSFVLARKRLGFRDVLEKMLPSYLMVFALAFSLLLIE